MVWHRKSSPLPATDDGIAIYDLFMVEEPKAPGHSWKANRRDTTLLTLRCMQW